MQTKPQPSNRLIRAGWSSHQRALSSESGSKNITENCSIIPTANDSATKRKHKKKNNHTTLSPFSSFVPDKDNMDDITIHLDGNESTQQISECRENIWKNTIITKTTIRIIGIIRTKIYAFGTISLYIIIILSIMMIIDYVDMLNYNYIEFYVFPKIYADKTTISDKIETLPISTNDDQINVVKVNKVSKNIPPDKQHSQVLENYKNQVLELKNTIKKQEEYISKLTRKTPEQQGENKVFDRIRSDLSDFLYVEINEYLKGCDLNITFTTNDIKSYEHGFYTIAVDFWNLMYEDLKTKMKSNKNSPYNGWFDHKGSQRDIYDELKEKSVDIILQSLMEDHAEYRCCCKYGEIQKFACGSPIVNIPPEISNMNKNTKDYVHTNADDNGDVDERNYKSPPKKINASPDVNTRLESNQKPQCIIMDEKMETSKDYTQMIDNQHYTYDKRSELYINVGLHGDFFNTSRLTRLEQQHRNQKNTNNKIFDPYLLNCKISFIIF